MSDPATPWWAEVQHLRPREDRAPDTPAPRTQKRRFDRAAQPAPRESAIATLEHELADPWADSDPVWGPEQADWDAAAAAIAEPSPLDAPAAPSPVWDDSLEEAFARTPSWSDDEDWMLPKGADRIENGRRTIEIRGQVDRIHGFTAPLDTRAATRTGRRGVRRPSERFERRPDRVAMWAFLLGILLILVAAFSKPGDADAATPAQTAPAPAAHVLVVDVPAPAALPRG